jgi:hypothetical protein
MTCVWGGTSLKVLDSTYPDLLRIHGKDFINDRFVLLFSYNSVGTIPSVHFTLLGSFRLPKS